MSERAMQFRIGVFVLLALVMLGVLVALFSGMPSLFRRQNPYTVVLADAPGVAAGTPVRRSGVRIGEVRSLELDDATGVVRVHILVDSKHALRKNEQPRLTHGLFGDTTINMVTVPAKTPEDRAPVEEGAEIMGVAEPDVQALVSRAATMAPAVEESLASVGKLVQRVDQMGQPADDTLREFRELARDLRQTIPDLRRSNKEMETTLQNWGKAGARLDDMLRVNQDRVSGALDSLNTTLSRMGNFLTDENQKNFNALLKNLNTLAARMGNYLTDENQKNFNALLRNLSSASEQLGKFFSEDNQRNASAALQNLRTASDSLPSVMKNADEMLKEGRQGIAEANKLLGDLQKLIAPLSERSERLLQNFDETSDRLIRVLTEMEGLLQVINHGDGTIQRLLSDPSLYQHANELACFWVRMLPRLDRMMRDMEVFVDKLARHPEVLGVGGVVRPSSGLK